MAVLEEGMNNTTALISSDSSYFTLLSSLLSGLIGVVIGGFITFYLDYAKTKAMMKWETKYATYNAILELDKGRPLISAEKEQQYRLAKRLVSLSDDEEIKNVVYILIQNKFESLNSKQKFMDKKFIPTMKKDLEDTMSFFRWPWK